MTAFARPDRNLPRNLLAWVSDGTLWLIALLHVVLAASLVVTLFFVAEADAKEAECGGSNVLTALAKSDPTRFAALEAEAAAVPNGKGIFWKIEKDGIAPSWLLGTMHVTDPRVLALPTEAPAAFEAASTVIVESDEIIDEKKSAAAILMRPDLTMFPDNKTIADFLKPGDRERLEAGLKARGIPLTLVARMKPWMIASFVALPACEITRKATGASFLDKKIAEDAVSQGKALKGLESLIEQLAAMDSLPTELHLRALIETLALGKTIDDVFATMTDLYLAGDTGMIMPMMRAVDTTSSDDFGYADFEQRIIVDRNRTMATRAEPILKNGAAFMAVGALHLPGKEGLVELLRAQGFTVTRAN
ncbi:TraB/GumN family protein [Ensifer adhaerens]|uniref:TraB/GumN family protein n=1 Tax=Ensifer adhaerens TaxID=106592 RepID=UPI001CBF4D5C|nr:TraB/GumN family protein [Ensifer adhaerens]MBZ7923516.1 TraB/GumN family protein [Ensifer adhaerens]UAX92078.1 TraB/GumN family protein [Ensifer adhaerens]UAX99710.1 TraB/GumN family protein [Ensifer adhaerens]UAY07094.1 TraB/GumN family protein [Ensifer adhaerens]